MELLRRKETDKNAVKKQHIQAKKMEKERLKKQEQIAEAKRKSAQKLEQEKGEVDDYFEGGGQSQRS